MALVTFCGFPCSGKTTRAEQLATFLQHKLAAPTTHPSLARLKVIIINDESLNLSKSAYDGKHALAQLSERGQLRADLHHHPPPADSRAEKPARATLFSAVTRVLNRDNIVIVDAMNYIKGSRYQMYCQVREASARNCTVSLPRFAVLPSKLFTAFLCRGEVQAV